MSFRLPITTSWVSRCTKEMALKEVNICRTSWVETTSDAPSLDPAKRSAAVMPRSSNVSILIMCLSGCARTFSALTADSRSSNIPNCQYGDVFTLLACRDRRVAKADAQSEWTTTFAASANLAPRANATISVINELVMDASPAMWIPTKSFASGWYNANPELALLVSTPA
jgi:hypothetical protein